MPIEINLIRADKGGDPEKIKKLQQARFKSVELIDEVIQLDQDWRKARYAVEQLRKNYSKLNKQVGQRKKANKEDPCTDLIEQMGALDKQIEEATKVDSELLNKVNEKLCGIGNPIHESVPISNNEDDNRIERQWGEPIDLGGPVDAKTPGRYHHDQVLQRIGGFESERGRKVAAHRAYYLTGPGVLLNSALVQYGIRFLQQRNYVPVQPPFFMKKSVMSEVAELADFDDQLYKVTAQEDEEGCYLIATSEQPIAAMHSKESIDVKLLPIKYAGVSTCFRREAGAHGKDNWGIFRVHQFEKVEQFVISKPEDSCALHEEMIRVAEEFYQSLNLPYRVVSIVSGALNLAASKKYDLEAWFPGYNTYRELVSCSNCTDFQSRAAKIRYGITKKQNEAETPFVHMLNGTLCATERTLCCILENYQTPTGLKVPDVLQSFVGTDFIPYTRELAARK